MTINALIAYAYENKLNFDEHISVLSESVINDEITLIEDYPSFAISHEDKHLLIMPRRIATEKEYKKELKHIKVESIATDDITPNISVDINMKILTKEDVAKILEVEFKCKNFADISIVNKKIFIQISEKEKTEKIENRFYGYSVLFDKMNPIWFKKNKDLEYRWEYGKKVTNK